MVAESDLGKIVVDGEGRTLYLFTNDSSGLPTCYDDCAATWPALMVDGAVTVGAGLAADDAQTIPRNDGTRQVTIFGWPLYYYAADAAPGDHQGQGRGDVWFVVSPETAQPIR